MPAWASPVIHVRGGSSAFGATVANLYPPFRPNRAWRVLGVSVPITNDVKVAVMLQHGVLDRNNPTLGDVRDRGEAGVPQDEESAFGGDWATTGAENTGQLIGNRPERSRVDQLGVWYAGVHRQEEVVSPLPGGVLIAGPQAVVVSQDTNLDAGVRALLYYEEVAMSLADFEQVKRESSWVALA